MTAAETARRRFFAPLREGVSPGAPWVEYAARAGYLAIGIVYGLFGLLAIHAAFTAARIPDTRDALDAIRVAPFGRILLAAVAAGLVCYAGWRMIQAWFDTEHKGSDAKGIFIRVGFALSGLAYLGLGIIAGLASFRGGSTSDSGENQQAAATVLSYPGGWIAVAVTGLVVIGVGIVHFRKVYTADFMQEYDRTEMSQAERDWAKPVGRFGLAARGTTFCLIGLFLTLAGWRANAGEVKSVGEAFNILAAQPYGQVLLAVVAAGFVAFGVYCLSQAKYKRIWR